MNTDIIFMRKAIELAAKHSIDCPIVCIVTIDNCIVAAERNRVEERKDPTAHAELLAIQKTCMAINSKYLLNATLYCTLEPCTMCSSAIKLARVSRVVFGAFRNRASSSTNFIGGILEEECSVLLKDFFLKLRTLN